ncbi:MAG TPA: Rrf2 family transcriptional regulator [Terriglobales bacterium]|nr:Rrf2 family transcriptional regulator [Terriglobales bacterium]
MQITRATDYAVRVMIYMATHPPHTRLAVPDVARGIEAPESFVSKILQQLVQRGMVTSHRGSGGGFELEVDPETVSLLDVVEMVEGPLQINVCLPGAEGCDRKSWCGAHPIWTEAQSALKHVLASATIAKLARESAANLARLEHGETSDSASRAKGVSPRPDRRKGRPD